MTRRLFWKLCIVIGVGTITLFYIINMITAHTEEGMSYISKEDQNQILSWGDHAEMLYRSGDEAGLKQWLDELANQENTWAAVIEADLTGVAGSVVPQRALSGKLIGRDVSWKIHLYFSENPTIEVTFSNGRARFLVKLPDRMRPGAYLAYMNIVLQIILPMLLLIPLSFVIYNHIMSPLRQLERATRLITEGNYNTNASRALGSRSDELAQLAEAFDFMAARTGDLIVGQRQLISDLSHELRTPLTRLDIAISGIEKNENNNTDLGRVHRESAQIRKLVEDTLTLAWLENEQREFQSQQIESVDLVDLIDVLLVDAQFEYPNRLLESHLPDNALIHNSNHRAVGQALENVLRNAFRYTPADKVVKISLEEQQAHYLVRVEDSGPGVPVEFLEAIFRPFYRLEGSRNPNGGFGLGLALAKRQLESVKATIVATSSGQKGLIMDISLPK